MAKRKKIRLGVNLDHVATLRQVRGGTTAYPSLLDQMESARRGGAEQITVHLREDRRHIQDKDIMVLLKACQKKGLTLNLEIAPIPQMLKFALNQKPHCVCFVPEKRKELTTEGGLDVLSLSRRLQRFIVKLQKNGIFVSLFIEPNRQQIQASALCGADAVEFHTGKFVLLKGRRKAREWERLKQATQLAHNLNLKVHAGHGLDDNNAQKVRGLPHLEEVNVGHFLICEALNVGMEKAVRKIKKVLC